eukprot:3718744-Lingulodinium_polyedra.AAC.1
MDFAIAWAGESWRLARRFLTAVHPSSAMAGAGPGNDVELGDLLDGLRVEGERADLLRKLRGRG